MDKEDYIFAILGIISLGGNQVGALIRIPALKEESLEDLKTYYSELKEMIDEECIN